jgi:hypothetical protein
MLLLVLCHACRHFTSSYASLAAMQERVTHVIELWPNLLLRLTAECDSSPYVNQFGCKVLVTVFEAVILQISTPVSYYCTGDRLVTSV